MRILLAAALAASTALAATREIPELRAPVLDEAGLLSTEERSALNAELSAYPPALQLTVWIVNGLDGEAIESLAMRAVEKWKLGTTKEDRGALMLVAIQERSARIEIGYGLEGEIPDALAARMIDGILVPAFRSGNYYGGIQGVAREMYRKSGGDSSTLAAASSNSNGPVRRLPIWGRGLLALFILVISIFSAVVNASRGGRRRFRGGGFGGGYGGGGFGGFGGGGGGWSGGGGGFGGGGASGKW